MSIFSIESKKDKIVISIDKSLMDTEYILNLLEKLRLEYLAKKANLNEDIMEVGEQIKKEWWKNNKKTFLKGIIDEDSD